jgi:RND family efflux transporter MFP subunit
MSRRKVAIVAACGAIAVAAIVGWRYLSQPAVQVPTVEARMGEFVDYVQIRGEVKATRSTVIAAPPGAGDLLILTLVPNGSTVKKGDLVAQFDTTTVQRTLEQRQTDLKSAEAEIQRSKAQFNLDREQKLTDRLNADYDVQRSKLDVSKQEILSEIDAAKAKLTLANSEQKLRETDQKVQYSEDAGKADNASRRQKRNKALYDVRLAETQIASMTLRAPVDGTVTVSPNFRNWGPGGAPEFKQGDRAWPGAGIAEIPDLRSIRVIGHVDEIDRGRLSPGQKAIIRIDAVPDKEFPAEIGQISAVAKPDFSSWPPVKNFDITLQMKDNDARMRPGMSASVRVIVARSPQVLLVPAEAIFQKDGQSVVYVLRGSGFQARKATIGQRGSGDVVILAGVKAGERVALKDPTKQEEAQ